MMGVKSKHPGIVFRPWDTVIVLPTGGWLALQAYAGLQAAPSGTVVSELLTPLPSVPDVLQSAVVGIDTALLAALTVLWAVAFMILGAMRGAMGR